MKKNEKKNETKTVEKQSNAYLHIECRALQHNANRRNRKVIKEFNIAKPLAFDVWCIDASLTASMSRSPVCKCIYFADRSAALVIIVCGGKTKNP